MAWYLIKHKESFTFNYYFSTAYSKKTTGEELVLLATVSIHNLKGKLISL